METEIWKEIEGYPDYLVSNFGVVKSVDRYRRCKIGYRIHYGKVLKVHTDRDGYKYVHIKMCANRGTTKKLHRLIAQAFIPNLENKPTINHKNGIKGDNRIENLEWATHKEQSEHARRNGLLVNHGEFSTSSKLTTKDVLAIRESKLSLTKLAKIYNVDFAHVGLIKRRKSWAWLK